MTITCIRAATMILTTSSKQFGLDKVEVRRKSSKNWFPMMLQGYRETHRVEVVERDLFTTPKSLKSHEGQKVLSPLVQYSCRNAKVVHPFDANTRRETHGTQITDLG